MIVIILNEPKTTLNRHLLFLFEQSQRAKDSFKINLSKNICFIAQTKFIYTKIICLRVNNNLSIKKLEKIIEISYELLHNKYSSLQ